MRKPRAFDEDLMLGRARAVIQRSGRKRVMLVQGIQPLSESIAVSMPVSAENDTAGFACARPCDMIKYRGGEDYREGFIAYLLRSVLHHVHRDAAQ